MPVDVNQLSSALSSFIRRHGTEFSRLTQRRSQLLEMGALTATAKHYEIHGYRVVPRNLRSKQFRVKLGTKGHPWNFSWFDATRGTDRYEIHGNLPVEDAVGTDGARYVVDVAVIRSGALPDSAAAKKRFFALANNDMATFVEAKSLVVYPMLLAQFIGIVHELKPRFIGGRRPRGFLASDHFDPALVSLGYLHGTCKNIVSGFDERGIRIRIVPAFDEAVASLRFGSLDSPFDAK